MHWHRTVIYMSLPLPTKPDIVIADVLRGVRCPTLRDGCTDTYVLRSYSDSDKLDFLL